MEEDLEMIVRLLPFLVPLFLLEVGLLVFALLDVIKRKRVRGDNKVVWILVIVLVNIIGPIIYFIFGRMEDPVDSN